MKNPLSLIVKVVSCNISTKVRSGTKNRKDLIVHPKDHSLPIKDQVQTVSEAASLDDEVSGHEDFDLDPFDKRVHDCIIGLKAPLALEQQRVLKALIVPLPDQIVLQLIGKASQDVLLFIVALGCVPQIVKVVIYLLA